MRFFKQLFLLFLICGTYNSGFATTSNYRFRVDFLSINKLENVMVYHKKVVPDEENCFYEVILSISNESDSKLQVNLNDIVLEGNGYFRAKDFLSKNSGELSANPTLIKLGKGKQKRINLYYQFPLSLHPNNLIIENRQMMNISNGQKDDILLINKGQVTANINEAAYRREFTWRDSMWIVKDYYYPENRLEMEFTCTSIYPMEKEGPYKKYYLNGTIKEEGEFSKNFPAGYERSYYDNGNKKGVYFHDGRENRYYHYYDKAGNDLLVNGTGTFSYYNDQGAKTWYKVKDSLTVASYHVTDNSTDTIFFVAGSIPVPIGGMRAFYLGIQQSLRYPAEARRRGIQGKVFVQFIVNKEGKLEDITAVKGIGHGCDVAAEKAVGESVLWTPAEFEGKKVKVRMILPITFKLG